MAWLKKISSLVGFSNPGLVPTLPNDASVFFNGIGTYSTPSGGGAASAVPIVITSNLILAVNTGWVIPEALEIAAGIILEIEGGAKLEITGGNFPNMPLVWGITNGIIINPYLASNGALPFQPTIGALIPDDAALNVRLAYQTLLSGTYTFIVTFTGNEFLTNSTVFGIYISDGTKIIGFELLNQTQAAGGLNRLRVERYNTTTSNNTTVAGPTQNLTALPLTLKIEQRNGARSFYYYTSSGWALFYTEAINSFLTETQVGFGGICVTGTTASVLAMQILSWQVSY